ncbi:LAFE_0G07338g1_1 [Lachancea fermentati]|uniref:LAFE_0G07338g1_1 n=1 Tax=Lachancea fermentati TaxID=4955 RepID=A0A1G4MHB7_LACFM|nr:LAFE_0G07338g1_1 [Lachancea fermentati]
MGITIHVKSGQNKWDVSVEPSSSVAELKEAISKVSEIPAENQRLIFSGKILKDDQSVESYKIEDGHAIHLVKSGGAKPAASGSGSSATEAAPSSASAQATPSVPSNLSSGQTGGFNPLADLTSARYAGFLNLPSADTFGPDGGLNNAPNSDDMLRMLENPVMQSQMNEMLSNPQMIDFLIQQSPQLQNMGPQARQLLQSPFFRQMMTNPDMIRQSMQFANMFGGAEGGADVNSFPAPGSATGAPASSDATESATENRDSNVNPQVPPANPFASLLNPQAGNLQGNPFASMFGQGASDSNSSQAPAFDPTLLSSLLGSTSSAAQPQDNRPPEERYEQQLRQLNDMGFFEFDRNVAALRRSGGSVQGALDALLNGDV